MPIVPILNQEYINQYGLRGGNVPPVNQRQTGIIRTFNDIIVMASASIGSLFEKSSAKTFMIWNPPITQKTCMKLVKTMKFWEGSGKPF